MDQSNYILYQMIEIRLTLHCMVQKCNQPHLAILAPKDGNGSGLDLVESPCTQNQNLKSKPKPETDSGGNPSPKPNPWISETRMDTQNPWINIHIFTCINKRQ